MEKDLLVGWFALVRQAKVGEIRNMEIKSVLLEKKDCVPFYIFEKNRIERVIAHSPLCGSEVGAREEAVKLLNDFYR